MPEGANRKKCILTVPDTALRNFFWKHDIYCCICMITWIRIPNTDRDSYGSETLLRWQPYWLYKRILWVFPYTILYPKVCRVTQLSLQKLSLARVHLLRNLFGKQRKVFPLLIEDGKSVVRRRNIVGTVSGFLFRGIPVPIKPMHVCF